MAFVFMGRRPDEDLLPRSPLWPFVVSLSNHELVDIPIFLCHQ